MNSHFTIFLQSFRELSSDMRSAPIYTYSGKGWGGALLQYKDSKGQIVPVGLDCSGLVTGFFSRWGKMPHSYRMNWNAEKLRNECELVSEEKVRPLDLVFYGGNRASHVAIVADPQKLIFESGGGYSKTLPPGEYEKTLHSWGLDFVRSEDWYPKNGRVRFSDWDYRRSDLIGFGRLSYSGVTSEDKDLVSEWNDHVRVFLEEKQKIPLSKKLKRASYRPVYAEYLDKEFLWKVNQGKKYA